MIRRVLLLGLLSLSMASYAMAADEDTLVASALFSDPLTARELPLGYTERPPGWRSQPLGFREKPIQWRPQPLGYRDRPIQQLLEPRNGRETPPRFVERDSIIVANLDPILAQAKEDQLAANNSLDLRLEVSGSDASTLKHSIASKEPGYKGINPPSKARLQDFQ